MERKLTFDELIWLNRTILKINGLIPITRVQFPWKKLLRFSLVIVLCCNITIIVAPGMKMLLFRQFEQDSLVDVLVFLVCVIGCTCRILLALYRQSRIQHLLCSCEKLWNDAQDNEDYKILSQWGLRGRTLTMALFSSAFGTISFFLLTPVLKGFDKFSNSTTRNLPFPSPIGNSPEYEINYALQVVASFGMGSAIMGVDTVILVLILHGCGQFRLIQYWLQSITDCNNDIVRDEWYRNVRRTVQKCVTRHRMILNYCKELEEVVSETNLVLVVSCMYVASLSTVKLFIGDADLIKYTGLLSLAVQQLLFVSWPSDNLSSESFAVSIAAYDTPWHRFDRSLSRTINITIMMAQKPVMLTAGKFVKMSLETFSSIMSSAVSLFTVLHNV